MRSAPGERRRVLRMLAGLGAGLAAGRAAAEPPPSVTFAAAPDGLEVRLGGRPVARYVHGDPRISRPYFTDLRTTDGLRVTRSHPPVPGVDPTDHETMHPGAWLAFGDLSGADFWRNRAPVRHEGFAAAPRGGTASGRFAVRNRYLSPAGEPLCLETGRYTFRALTSGWLLDWESELEPLGKELVFGDQEEMGLGVRLATPLSVARGGEIRDSAGRRNEREAWGKQADWCDYRGVIDGRSAGIALLVHPTGFGRPWFHVRDYGLMVANAFGRAAFTGGEKSRVTVPAGERLRLRFGLWIRSGAPGDPAPVYAEYRHAAGWSLR